MSGPAGHGRDGTRRPRLVVVASTFPARPDDGTPPFVRDLSVQLAHSFDTVVLVPRTPGAPASEQIGGVSVERFAYFPRRWETLAHGAIFENLRSKRMRWLQVLPFLLSEGWHLRRLIRRHRPDVVHLHWVVPQGFAALLGARRVPWVVTTHGGDVYAVNDPFSRWLRRRVFRRAAAVTAVNAEVRDKVLAQGARPEATFVQSVGANVAAFKSLAPSGAPTAGRMLFVGRLVEKKGLGVLLDALRLLPDDAQWSLEVAGDGPLRPSLMAQAEGLPVTFAGQVTREQLAAAYTRSSLVVVPSVAAASGDQDGLPTVLLEAMGFDRAIVASDLPGINEAVEHGKSALLVPPGDADALATALGAVLRDDALRERLGEAAALRSAEYSVESCAKRFVEILSAAAATRTAPPSSSADEAPTEKDGNIRETVSEAR